MFPGRHGLFGSVYFAMRNLVVSVARCAMLSVMGSAGVVLDLFHTLVDTEHLRPVGFDAVAEVANVIGVEPARFAAFWDETYVERETTMLDLVELTVRFCHGVGVSVSGEQLEQVDVLFGVCKDDTLRCPDQAMVELIASLAARCAVGVLSNCEAREVRPRCRRRLLSMWPCSAARVRSAS